MKGRFDLFTDKELSLLEDAFNNDCLWSLLGEVNDEQKRRSNMKPAERKAYEQWRTKFINHIKEVSKIE